MYLFPQLQVKSAGIEVKGQDLDPEEIRADQSSLSTTIPDKSSNIKSVVSLRGASLVLWEDHRPHPPLCLYPQLSPHYSFPTDLLLHSHNLGCDSYV